MQKIGTGQEVSGRPAKLAWIRCYDGSGVDELLEKEYVCSIWMGEDCRSCLDRKRPWSKKGIACWVGLQWSNKKRKSKEK